MTLTIYLQEKCSKYNCNLQSWTIDKIDNWCTYLLRFFESKIKPSVTGAKSFITLIPAGENGGTIHRLPDLSFLHVQQVKLPDLHVRHGVPHALVGGALLLPGQFGFAVVYLLYNAKQQCLRWKGCYSLNKITCEGICYCCSNMNNNYSFLYMSSISRRPYQALPGKTFLF